MLTLMASKDATNATVHFLGVPEFDIARVLGIDP
jgi:hypothetical protein